MNKQTGSALILSLLILLVMTMLGITAMSTSSLEEKMAANDRNQKIAFQNAELTLAEAEDKLINDKWLEDDADKEEGIYQKIASDTPTPGYYGADSAKPKYLDKTTWDTCIDEADNNQSDYTACYIYEHVTDQLPLEAGGGYGQINQSNVGHKILKVSARSTDANGVAAAIVQSTARKTFIP